MFDVGDFKKWVATLVDTDTIGVDEGGLCLVVTNEQNVKQCWLEIGGTPDGIEGGDTEDDDDVPDNPNSEWVFTLVVSEANGEWGTVHATEEGARKVLLGYVWEHWYTLGPGRDDEENSVIPDDPTAAIEAYFESRSGIDSYTLECAEVQK